ncbi:MAG: glycerol-3-phosphate acyltransferase [Dehalococcoidia bacterium]
MTVAVVIVAAYLLGSVPTSYIVVHRFTGRDIRTMGTGNPGTMNVLDSVGFRAAFLAGAGDVVKGMAAVGLALAVGLDDLGVVLTAFAAVVGHDYSVFLRFDGGHGTAAVIGSLLMLMPLEAGVAGSTGFALALLIRNRRIGGLVSMALLPALAVATDVPAVRVYGAFALMAFMLVQIVRDEGFSLSPVRTRARR